MTSAVNLPMQACRTCGQVDSLGRVVCAKCFGTQFDAATVAGSGRLVTWTTIRRAPTRFRDDAPYDVCVVDLESGHRVTGRLASFEAKAPGMNVAASEIRNDTPIFVISPT